MQVDYYGAPTPLKSLASIAVPDASTLTISPFDKGSIKDIEKAILESDVGINPNNDGARIRLIIPPMTQVRLVLGVEQGLGCNFVSRAGLCVKVG